MAPSGMATVKASASIPLRYRILLLYMEPIFALGGVFLCFFDPGRYVSTMTRDAVSSIDPRTTFIYTELAGGWLHFAFTEAVVLRLVDDLRIWRLLCVGMLMSDLAYCHSCAEAVGGWMAWLDLSKWTTEDWTVTVTYVC